MALFGKGKKKVSLVAPFTGRVVTVDEVPDQVFAQAMLGDGYALIPPEGQATVDVLAPVSGQLINIFGTRHAFAIIADGGLEVLVHIGLDTVELRGEGFEALAEAGEKVSAGQPVIRMDVTKVRESGRDPITPVVFTNASQVGQVKVTTGEVDNPKTTVCTVTMA